jgi:hypothetical protein
MSNGMEFRGRGGAPTHPGRHRRGGAESWTPPLPQHRPPRHHAAGSPVDPPVSGSLPLPQPSSPRPAGGRSFAPPAAPPQPSLPQPRDRRPAPPLFPAAHGSLPLDDASADDLDDPGLDPGPAEWPGTESRAEQAARRTRVSLATPKPRGSDQDDDDVRIYAVPPIDGLGGFTIGSVPASVTPPKTWRKAAWFATGASGAVVVGLLCAGSFLVGKPPMDQAVQGPWAGYQGAPTVLDPTSDQLPPSEGGGAAGPDTATHSENAAGTTSGEGGAPADGATPPPAAGTGTRPGTGTGTGGPHATGTTTPGGVPRKPPVTPAQRETPAVAPWWYSFPPDAQTMGDNSEKFFNTVTTDPGTASSVTTGELHDQGPQALSERYAGIAYFEVKKISIDQERGVTVNTVEVTHTDGTKTVEQRTLTFGDGDKIASDGR